MTFDNQLLTPLLAVALALLVVVFVAVLVLRSTRRGARFEDTTRLPMLDERLD